MCPVATQIDGLRPAVAEQAALRRVATLIARGATRARVYEAATAEVGRLMPSSDANLLSFEGGGMATMIGRWNEHDGYVEIQARLAVGTGTLAQLISESGRPSRITNYGESRGPLADMIRGWGWRSSVGAPVVVDAELWGLTAVGSRTSRQLPAGTEDRLAAFTELLAIAIANEQNRERLEQLVAEQGALRRVAELAVHDAPPSRVLDAVVTEASRLVGVGFTTLLRFEPDGATEVVAIHDPPPGVTVGMRAPKGGDGASQRVWRTGRTARVDDLSGTPGAWPKVASGHGFSSSAAAPVRAEDRLWGVLVAVGHDVLAPPIEDELSRFAALAGTAITSSHARTALGALAGEQAALLRVAGRVARGDPPEKVFAAVSAEAKQLLGGLPMTLVQFDEEDEALVVMNSSGGPIRSGVSFPYPSGTLPDRVRRTGRAARIDDYRLEPDAEAVARLGVVAAVAAPIQVENRVWGMFTATSSDGPLPARAEDRLQRFANLVGTAIGNATSRALLVASRERVLTAADETRRRLQRDVHDGAQQRLVQTVITLKLARSALADDQAARVLERVEEALAHAERANEELRELVSGILPAALTRAGLPGGVGSLVTDLPVRVHAAIDVPRLAPELETTAYFVIAEALTNVVKHAKAEHVRVLATLSDGAVRVEVSDDGVGGARADDGSGLTGLFDRVEARGGTLDVRSPPREGTTLKAILPADGRAAGVSSPQNRTS